jgi:hypothetical protein
MPAYTWNNTQKGIWGFHPPVKLEVAILTLIVLFQRKTKQKNVLSGAYKRCSWTKLTLHLKFFILWCIPFKLPMFY